MFLIIKPASPGSCVALLKITAASMKSKYRGAGEKTPGVLTNKNPEDRSEPWKN